MPRGADQYPGGDVHRPRAAADADVGLGIEGPRDVRRFSHEAMATVFEVYAVHPDEQYAGQAAQAAFDLIDRLERELSRFLTNSDITRINHLAAGESTRVSPSTLECLIIARHMFALTLGAFDVSIGTGLPSLELDPDEVVVRGDEGRGTRRPGRGRQGLRGRSHGGTDRGMGCRGCARARGLQLGPRAGAADRSGGLAADAQRPRAPARVLARLSVRQTALGASGLRKGDHIVDPRTGEPVRGRVAAWAAVPRPEAAGSRGGGAARRRRGSDGRLDDCVHVDEHRGNRSTLRAESRARGMDPSGAAGRCARGRRTGSHRRTLGLVACPCHYTSGQVPVVPRCATGRVYFGERRRSRRCQLQRERRTSRDPAQHTGNAAGRSDTEVGLRRRTMAQTTGDRNGWRERKRQGEDAGGTRRAQKAGPPGSTEGAVHRPGSRRLRLRVEQAARVSAGEVRGGLGAAGRLRPACRKSTSPCSAPGPRGRC